MGRHAQLRSAWPAASTGRSRTEETVTYSRHRHRRFSQRDGLCVISFSGRKGEEGKRTNLVERTLSRRRRNTPLHLTLGANVLAPSSPFGRQQRVPSRALPGEVRNETGGRTAHRQDAVRGEQSSAEGWRVVLADLPGLQAKNRRPFFSRHLVEPPTQ